MAPSGTMPNTVSSASTSGVSNAAGSVVVVVVDVVSGAIGSSN